MFFAVFIIVGRISAVLADFNKADESDGVGKVARSVAEKAVAADAISVPAAISMLVKTLFASILYSHLLSWREAR